MTGDSTEKIKRQSVSFPLDVYEKVEKIAEDEHRPVNSVIVQACDFFAKYRSVVERRYEVIQRDDYQELLERLRKDLGKT